MPGQDLEKGKAENPGELELQARKLHHTINLNQELQWGLTLMSTFQESQWLLYCDLSNFLQTFLVANPSQKYSVKRTLGNI